MSERYAITGRGLMATPLRKAYDDSIFSPRLRQKRAEERRLLRRSDWRRSSTELPPSHITSLDYVTHTHTHTYAV